MSITETSIPTGTWSLDKAHSSVGFAIGYIAGTFQGSFAEFDADVSDGARVQSAVEALGLNLDTAEKRFLEAPYRPRDEITDQNPVRRPRTLYPD